MIAELAELVLIPVRALRRSVAWWSIGLAAVVAITVAFWPAFRGASGISEAIDQLPAAVVTAFGLQDFGSPAGFLRGNLYELLVPLLLAIAAIAFVGGQTAGEEAAGRLEIYLAQPVARRALFIGRVAAGAIALLSVLVVVAVAQVAADGVFGLDIPPDRLGATLVLCGLLAALAGGVASAIAGGAGRPSRVYGLSIGLTIAAYLVSALFGLNETLAPWRQASPWNWALGGDPLVNATEAWRYVALAGPAILLALLGAWSFGRRDVAAA